MPRYFWLKYDGKIVEEITRKKYQRLMQKPASYKHKFAIVDRNWLGLINCPWIRLDVLKQVLEACS